MNEKEMCIYMAGFFDGEGYVGLLKRNRNRQYPEYIIQTAIGQKDGGTMDWIKENFGGHLSTIKRDGTYFWITTNKNALEFLKKIVPYLKYKKPQVELAIEFYKGMSKQKKITPEEFERREDIYKRLKEMKKVFIKSTYCI